MLAYNETVKQFKNDVLNNNIVNKISFYLRAGISEQSAWQDAAIYMNNIIQLANLKDDIEVGMELKIPITNNRIDFLIAGINKDFEKTLLIIELKRWSLVSKTNKTNIVNADDTRYGKDSLHPSYQAYSYKLNLEAYNEVVHTEKILINSCSYLHNLRDDKDIKDLFYANLLKKSPVFTSSDNQKLADFIRKYIATAHRQKILYQIENSRIRPSTMLMNTLSKELTNSPIFTLLNKQEICFQNIRRLLLDHEKTDQKQVIIVRGGAGTGKSVIAIKLLNEFIQNKKICFYITKNSAVRNVYGNMLSGNQNEHLKTLFLSTIKISRDRPINEYDCLVIDEAHRLPERSKSGNILLGQDLIKEIIISTKISIFFIDEAQQVDIRDYATIEKITTTAKLLGAKIHDNDNLRLTAQFRCAGNDEYVNAVDKLLFNDKVKYVNNYEFELKIFDDIIDWHKAISDKIENTKNSRMLAGDVFDWISKDDPNKYDINIDGLNLQWNRDTTFAAQDSQKHRVGHIDSVQGLEFDYIGLIIGDDLFYDLKSRTIKTDYKKHPKNAGHFRRHGRTKPLIEDLSIIDILIRNTYGVLLKRGMKGCYIYCIDKNLANYLKHVFYT
jgi:uncharacterized protein